MSGRRAGRRLRTWAEVGLGGSSQGAGPDRSDNDYLQHTSFYAGRSAGGRRRRPETWRLVRRGRRGPGGVPHGFVTELSSRRHGRGLAGPATLTEHPSHAKITV